jgi:NarL family two-component system response regulator LiaR
MDRTFGRLNDNGGARVTSSATIRLVLVDDHAVVTEGLSVLLARFADLDIVGTASGGAEAPDLVETTQPDVILMDLSMPGVDGVEATRRIIAAHPNARILALTAFIDHRLVNEAMAAGAAGYLLKSVSGDELAAAIRTVASGASILSPDALSFVMAERDRVGDDLTPRERDVLDWVARGLANKQIASELGLSPGTVRIHVSKILAKLQVDNRTAAARVARDAGLVAHDSNQTGSAQNR